MDTPKNLLRLVHFEENDDLVARIYTSHGSTPIVLKMDGKEKSYQDIGRQFVEAMEYFVKTEEYTIGDNIFDNQAEKEVSTAQ